MKEQIGRKKFLELMHQLLQIIFLFLEVQIIPHISYQQDLLVKKEFYMEVIKTTLTDRHLEEILILIFQVN